MTKIIHWFRRDLRLSDNTALLAASNEASQVIPVYILSSWKKHHGWTGPKRQEFLCQCLDSLAKNLDHIGSKLIFREGDAVAELERLVSQTGAEAIYFNRDPDPYGKAAEARLAATCERLGIRCVGFKDHVMHDWSEVKTGSNQPYRVYTPYSRNWLSLPKPSIGNRVSALGNRPEDSLQSLPVPTLAHWGLVREEGTEILPGGERAARERMETFLNSRALHRYSADRNTPAGVHNSMLSQDLRFGLISIRELYHRAQAVAGEGTIIADSVLTYTKELAWRDFYAALLHYYPQVLEQDFNQDFADVPWPGSEADLLRWQTGTTGFPIVDAGMRQLLKTGLMHNRVRMITAMFLTKDLHHHWKVGEQFFHQHLIDAEIGSNNGGWQWSAGTGADAAPYFRIQNPWLQSERFDADGAYIRQWVPELAAVPAKLLHAPPPGGRALAPGYPLPMVDHGTERDRCLARFKAKRSK
jgi:deoxyribodipyrimidine photo-lyase